MASRQATTEEALRQLQEEAKQARAKIAELERENKARRFEILELQGEFPNDEPDTEDPELLFFYRTSCPFTARVRPELKCLEEHLKTEGRIKHRLKKFEVERDPAGMQLLNEVDKGLCGGVPFFFNKRTGAYVCGARRCEDLKRWASNIKEEEENN